MSRLWAIFFHGQKVSEKVPSFYQVKKGEFNTGIVAATEKGDYDYTKADYTGPLCIIMGAEDTGVSYENLALCDEWVKIPMLGTIESLNVSVAAGILVYEAVKQRNND